MSDWQRSFLESCLGATDGVAVGDGAFRPGPGLWVGRREVAHFDDARVLDVRLTNAVIRARRAEFHEDKRVELRASASDWIEVTIAQADEGWVRGLVAEAVCANLPTAPSGVPPEGDELARRRRFH